MSANRWATKRRRTALGAIERFAAKKYSHSREMFSFALLEGASKLLRCWVADGIRTRNNQKRQSGRPNHIYVLDLEQVSVVDSNTFS
jgi:hypothetical protein